MGFSALRVLTVIIFACLIAHTTIRAQNLESIGKEDPFKVNGGVSLNQIFYKANGIANRRNPYSYFLTGNLNMSLYGWSVPLSFSGSNQNRTFQQPFNQFSIRPKYKWIQAYAGYSTMSFSPYTLNGHIFRGGGVELTPGKFHLSAMYGSLQRAVEQDTIRKTVPAFQRNGFGLKTGYRNGNDYLEGSLFHGKDDINSLKKIPSDDSLLPEENMVLGISLGRSFLEKFSVQGVLATSALTRDVRAEKRDDSNVFSKSGSLFTSRLSTSYYKAMKGGFSYRGTNYTVGAGYERIDPGYRTHGAYYFNSDLENYTINASTTLLEGKLNLSANAGRQHDNLDNSKVSTMRRFVGSMNMAYSPTTALSMSMSYSNFQSFTNVRSQFVNINQLTPYDNLDTLKFTQITQSVNMGTNYNLAGDANRKQFISANLSIQNAAEHQSQVTQNSGSRFYNLNTSYSLSFLPSSVTMSFSYNVNQNKNLASDLVTHGPSVAVNKSLMQRKLKLTLSSAVNNSVSEGKLMNRIINVRAGTTYSVAKKHNLNFGLVMVNRNSKMTTGPKSFTEFTGTLMYGYSF